MAGQRAALLIGKITHCRQEWQELSSLVALKVFRLIVNASAWLLSDRKQEYASGTRADFIKKCQSGEYDEVVGIYRSNESTSATGPFNRELVEALPSSLKYIAHNGAGYDNIDIAACTERSIWVSSTPIAVNDATADSMSSG